MKRLLLMTTVLMLVAGCNMNENKEARIRKLEAEMKKASSTIQELEDRVLELESSGKQAEN